MPVAREPDNIGLTVAGLAGMTPQERSRAKAKSIVSSARVGKYDSDAVSIDILSVEEIDGGVQVMARAWRDGKQLGFGKDGTVDIERFRIFNPPVLVLDPNGDIVRSETIRETGESVVTKLSHDPKRALEQVIVHAVQQVGKNGKNIVEGKVGRTTTVVYAHACDGDIYKIGNGWATVYGFATGTVSNSSASELLGFYESGSSDELHRGFFHFDTSAISDSDTIDSATIALVQTSSISGSPTAGIVQSGAASDTALDTGDYDGMGSTEGATRISITASVLNTWTLNATGLSWISKTGYTKLGVRLGEDIDNSTLTSGKYFRVYCSEQTGTTSDPVLTVEHTTPDVTNPSVSTLSPADNATGVSPTANLVITFDEAVNVETGNITIKKTSDNSTIEAIAVGSGQVTGDGTTTITVNPSVTLADLTEYYVLIDATAFDDLAGNSYAGIASTTAWSFTTADTTAPTVSTLSPADNAIGVSTTANLVITFAEAVAVGTGNITIKKTTGGATVEAIDVTSGQVTGTGTTTITINPSVTLAKSTEHYVLIDATAFDDLVGNSYAGIASTTAWSFTTEGGQMTLNTKFW